MIKGVYTREYSHEYYEYLSNDDKRLSENAESRGWEGRRKAISMNGGTFGRRLPLRSLVMFNTVPGSRVGRVGVAYQRVPPAGVVVCPTDPSQPPPRLWEGRAKAVFPSVNIKTPLPSPYARQICMTTKETRRERTGNRVSKLTQKTTQRWFSPLDFNRRFTGMRQRERERLQLWIEYILRLVLERKFLSFRFHGIPVVSCARSRERFDKLLILSAEFETLAREIGSKSNEFRVSPLP